MLKNSEIDIIKKNSLHSLIGVSKFELQVIARHLWMKNSIKEAVDAARIHHQLFPMEVSYEFGVTRPLLEGLMKLGHRILRYRDRGSVVCAVARINGTIYANADYRKTGDIYGID